MANINERLDKAKARFKDDKFLSNKGLSNEVGVYIFSYNPEDEMAVRHFLENINKTDKGFRAIRYDLYELFLNHLRNRNLLDKVIQLEGRSGKDVLERQLKNIMRPKDYVDLMKYNDHKYGDIIMISGVGKVYPFTRVHTLLENIAEEFRDIPIVVFYPGRYDDKTLQLFNQFFDDNHYRSFSLIK